MAKLFRAVREFFARNEGTSLTEYALALLLIAAVTIAGIAIVGNAISSFFINAAGTI
jgi:Flp pilus assembly pilin Flp